MNELLKEIYQQLSNYNSQNKNNQLIWIYVDNNKMSFQYKDKEEILHTIEIPIKMEKV